MKKVKLSLDGLRVESFQTAEIGKETGTVHARQITWPRPSCGYSCDDTCNESCTCPIDSNCNWTCFDC